MFDLKARAGLSGGLFLRAATPAEEPGEACEHEPRGSRQRHFSHFNGLDSKSGIAARVSGAEFLRGKLEECPL